MSAQWAFVDTLESLTEYFTVRFPIPREPKLPETRVPKGVLNFCNLLFNSILRLLQSGLDNDYYSGLFNIAEEIVRNSSTTTSKVGMRPCA